MGKRIENGRGGEKDMDFPRELPPRGEGATQPLNIYNVLFCDNRVLR